MSKKIIFKGNPDGCCLPFEPELLQLDLQKSKSEEPNKIEQLAKLSAKETKDFFLIHSRKATGSNCA